MTMLKLSVNCGEDVYFEASCLDDEDNRGYLS